MWGSGSLGWRVCGSEVLGFRVLGFRVQGLAFRRLGHATSCLTCLTALVGVPQNEEGWYSVSFSSLAIVAQHLGLTNVTTLDSLLQSAW